MNRLVVLAIAACMASTALSAVAYADPILPDPGLGIIGIGDPPDPQDVLDATPQMLTMETCSAVTFLGGFYCGEYSFSSGDSVIVNDGNSAGSIHSVYLSLW